MKRILSLRTATFYSDSLKNERKELDLRSSFVFATDCEVLHVTLVARFKRCLWKVIIVSVQTMASIQQQKDRRMKPPRPRRVSSAKPDTVNRSDDEDINGNPIFRRSPSDSGKKCLIYSSGSMGSGTSIDRHHSTLDGNYFPRNGDLGPQRQAPTTKGKDLSDYSLDSVNSAEEEAPSCTFADRELSMVHRSSAMPREFKQSTFKGESMLPVTMPRNSFDKTSHPILNTLFPPRGKYKFASAVHGNYQLASSESGETKSTTIRFGSVKLHQSSSQDLRAPSIPLDYSSEKTAMTYGTLRKTGASGSVSELFQKSKSKVRNSLRNWKFYTRNMSPEEKADADSSTEQSSPELLTPRPELYDPTVTKPDDLESFDWLSKSHPASSHRLREARTRAVLPVQIPTVDRCEIKKRTDSSISKQITPSKADLSDVNSEANGDSPSKNSTAMKKTPEQESIEILDLVIKSHSQSNHTILDSVQSPRTTCFETRISQEVLQKTNFQKEKLTEFSEISIKQDRADSSGVNYDIQRYSSSLTSPPRPNTSSTAEDNSSPSQIKATSILPTSSPDRKRSVVKCGMSVTDVLAEGIFPDPDNGNGSADSTRLSLSMNSQTFENATSSFDDSSSSLTDLPDFLEQEEEPTATSHSATIRKAGWLILKHFLVSKNRKLEKMGRRKWRRFWVNLKGGQLLCYEVKDITTSHEIVHPALIISVDGALMQAIPEHATKSNVMCMSTFHGSVYLLQAISQTEVDSWIQTVHIEAATIFAKQRQKSFEDATRKSINLVLQKAIDEMKHEIDEDEKMRKMAQLQNSLVPDVKSQRAIADQIARWEQSAEENHINVYRLRCYQISFETTELPNPQSAIATACKSSKQILNGLKLLNAATLYALIISKQLGLASHRKRSFTLNLSRSGSSVNFDDVSQTKRNYEGSKPKKSSVFGSLRGFDTWKGSSSGGSKKKQRTSVGGIISAFTPSPGSHTSSLKDERPKTPTSTAKHDMTWPILPPPSEDYGSALDSTDGSPDAPSDDELLNEYESVGGSLDSLLLAPPDAWCMPAEYESSSVRVSISVGEYVTVTTTENMTCEQLLEIVCQRKQLDSSSYFLVVGGVAEVDYGRPVSEVKGQSLGIKMKRQYSVELNVVDKGRGFDVVRPKPMCCPLVINTVTYGGIAETSGLRVGEEIVVLNGELTHEMSDAVADDALNANCLHLLIQTCYFDTEFKCKTWWPGDSRSQWASDFQVPTYPLSAEERRIQHLMTAMEDYLNNIIVRPPPVSSKLQPPFIRSPFITPYRKTNIGKRHGSIEDIVSLLVVPPPEGQIVEENLDRVKQVEKRKSCSNNIECDSLIDELLQKAEIVTQMCRQMNSMNPSSSQFDQCESGNGNDLHHSLSELEKIWKVVDELVDTESNYVRDLDCLLKRFLEPLHCEGFLANPEMESLLHSVESILNFQKIFLLELSEPLLKGRDQNDVSILSHCLLSVTLAFLRHAAQFKIYAVFSTCHTAAQTLVEQTKSESSEVRAFLEARNPKQQHSLSLDSYLIKPIQRVLKYPLLLRELLSLSESMELINTKAKRRLKAALHAMHGVARHINDAQTVHDEFGTEGLKEVMEQAAMDAFGNTEILSSLNLTNLLCYCSTEWLDAPDEIIARVKKGNVTEMLVLVFRSAIILLCRPTKQRDKKKVGSFQQEVLPPYTHCKSADLLYTDIIRGLQLSVTRNHQGDKNALELVSEVVGNKTTYKLLCNSLESKERIVKTARYVIRECKKSENVVEADDTQLVSDVGLPHANTTNLDKDISAQSLGTTTDLRSSIPGTPTPTRNRSQNFFYLPKRERYSTSNQSLGCSKDTIAMTIPLPTYEDAVNSITQSIKCSSSSEKLPDTRSTYSSSVKSRSKSAHRRSGLYISMVPSSHNFSESSFKSLIPDKGDQGNEKAVEVSSLHNIILANNNESNNVGGIPCEVSDCPLSMDVKTNHEQKPSTGNSATKYSKCDSPTRYNMVYGVAPYESKL